jgi:hypothetical protein
VGADVPIHRVALLQQPSSRQELAHATPMPLFALPVSASARGHPSHRHHRRSKGQMLPLACACILLATGRSAVVGAVAYCDWQTCSDVAYDANAFQYSTVVERVSESVQSKPDAPLCFAQVRGINPRRKVKGVERRPGCTRSLSVCGPGRGSLCPRRIPLSRVNFPEQRETVTRRT